MIGQTLTLLAALGSASAGAGGVSHGGPSSIAPGTVVFAAGHNVRLRAEPSLDAPVLASVPLGDELTIGAAAPQPATVSGRSSHWLPVRFGDLGGWVWGGTVTGARFETDLDANGSAELLTVSFSSSGDVLVRARDLSRSGDDAVQVVNLGRFVDINGLQDRARAEVLPGSVAGVPLVRVEIQAGEYCGSGSHFRYLSLHKPASMARPSLAVALSHAGSGGDAPIWWTTTVDFDPGQRSAVVRSESGEDDTTLSTSTRTYTRVDGIFVEQVDASAPQTPGRDASGG